MATVSVFVDEAVRGRLPMVCAKTGQPADLLVRTTQPVGGLPGAAWLLVFLGPPGWGVLLLLALFGSGQESLTVRIPRTHASFEWEHQMRRFMWASFVMGLASLALEVVFAGQPTPVGLVLGLAFLVVAFVLRTTVALKGVGVALDGSRRWVTLSGVHPDFARAVEGQAAETLRP